MVPVKYRSNYALTVKEIKNTLIMILGSNSAANIIPNKNNIGVAFGGNGGNGEKAKIVWDLPLNTATQDAGILTASSKSNSWTNCCNFSSDAETYDIGTNAYEFHYTGDVEDANKNCQIGLHDSEISGKNEISVGFVLTDVVYKILDGTTSELETSPVASDTWSLTINADRSGSWNKNDVAVATWSSSELSAGTYFHNATMYYQATYASATVE